MEAVKPSPLQKLQAAKFNGVPVTTYLIIDADFSYTFTEEGNNLKSDDQLVLLAWFEKIKLMQPQPTVRQTTQQEERQYKAQLTLFVNAKRILPSFSGSRNHQEIQEWTLKARHVFNLGVKAGVYRAEDQDTVIQDYGASFTGSGNSWYVQDYKRQHQPNSPPDTVEAFFARFTKEFTPSNQTDVLWSQLRRLTQTGSCSEYRVALIEYGVRVYCLETYTGRNLFSTYRGNPGRHPRIQVFLVPNLNS